MYKVTCNAFIFTYYIVHTAVISLCTDSKFILAFNASITEQKLFFYNPVIEHVLSRQKLTDNAKIIPLSFYYVLNC